MVNITLPDGQIKNFDQDQITGFDIAESISKSLTKLALALKIDGQPKDLNTVITQDSKVEIITPTSPDGLEIIRHDAAHLLAQAIKDLYPDAQITIGPVIENGFYYDVARDEPFTPDDLVKLEKRMKQISEENIPIQREEWDRDEAIKFFESIGELYKAEIIRDIPKGEIISLYRQGQFIDLCRGPHAPSTGKIKYFKLMKLAGAYWRGDSKNPMLQRIYGTAWGSEAELKDYLHMLEEAEKRDHRKLGRELNLFHIQEEAQGMIFWHHKGWTIYRLLENYIRDKIAQNGYIEVKTPVLVDRSLWEKSGHWEKFREDMFTSETKEDVLAIKPMNCPCHVQIFNQGIKSYRDLPLRMAEFGMCHRNEPSGSLHGLMRVRGFVQDDAHIFCTEDQITEETVKFCNLLQEVYHDLGFTNISVKFSDRPETRVGSDETWDRAEKALKDAVNTTGFEYSLNPGEGAFYGPKLEFVLKDAIGRHWQCGTLQVDFVMPERLGATYIGEDGQKHRPVMVHRAILGSLERFVGILIEEYSGKLPLWLAPVQIAVLNITNDADVYATQISEKLISLGLRVELDLDNEKINYKIRKHSLAKVPVMVIVGKKEVEENQLSVRLSLDKPQENMSFDEFVEMIKTHKLINLKTIN
ncbi:threonine--tRNA ligase [Rickettsiales endosymbiont of Stachyamoeba lipophora]|uniref:threonine--tRNA ligase n=1 Tax=Rickettsiales endosymbiont of Stachyamoeba lipophora TaxID=2486578 RepID=UPI000F64893A|nr:threonine--tRNA ligase [Rickettsiales endosymbiont of Stachyamoeba lipophora]AZL15318.1 threonine--tRNA ligase [Rickettsiales endosymbiont of Stachyamoeba lipophora]